MSKSNPIKEKSFAFAIRIVNLYKFLVSNHKQYVLSLNIPNHDQLIIDN